MSRQASCSRIRNRIPLPSHPHPDSLDPRPHSLDLISRPKFAPADISLCGRRVQEAGRGGGHCIICRPSEPHRSHRPLCVTKQYYATRRAHHNEPHRSTDARREPAPSSFGAHANHGHMLYAGSTREPRALSRDRASCPTSLRSASARARWFVKMQPDHPHGNVLRSDVSHVRFRQSFMLKY